MIEEIRDGMFVMKGDGKFVGKGLDALIESEKGRNQIIQQFGGKENLPSSIMKAKKEDATKTDDREADSRGYQKSCSHKFSRENKSVVKSLRDHFGMSGVGCSAGALSRFPQNVGKSILLFYSNPGDTVFDPFAGHNSRMDLCINNGRHYIGCDLGTNFMEFNRERAEQLREKYPEAKIRLHHCDSRKVPVKDNRGHFTITSPPYWDIEYYGDEPEQLGKSQTYGKFIDGLGQVMRENFRCVKSGAYVVWFVNDFRKKGKFYVYHKDVIDLAEASGFIACDLLVVDFGPGIRDAFLNQTIATRILPKRHEYGLVFRKP